MAIRETIGEPPMLDVYALGCCALFRVCRAWMWYWSLTAGVRRLYTW